MMRESFVTSFSKVSATAWLHFLSLACERSWFRSSNLLENSSVLPSSACRLRISWFTKYSRCWRFRSACVFASTSCRIFASCISKFRNFSSRVARPRSVSSHTSCAFFSVGKGKLVQMKLTKNTPVGIFFMNSTISMGMSSLMEERRFTRSLIISTVISSSASLSGLLISGMAVTWPL